MTYDELYAIAPSKATKFLEHLEENNEGYKYQYIDRAQKWSFSWDDNKDIWVAVTNDRTIPGKGIPFRCVYRPRLKRWAIENW